MSSRIASFSEGAFSSRDSVGCERRWRRVGQPPASEFEGGINAQGVKIVGVFVAAGDRQDAGANHVRQRVRDAQRSRRSGNQCANLCAIPNRRSAIESSITPLI